MEALSNWQCWSRLTSVTPLGSKPSRPRSAPAQSWSCRFCAHWMPRSLRLLAKHSSASTGCSLVRHPSAGRGGGRGLCGARTISCHIRKDLQQMEPALAYAKLVSEFTEAPGKGGCCQPQRAADRRGSLDPSAAPAGAPSSSVISAALGPSASAPTRRPCPQRRSCSSVVARVLPDLRAPLRRRYMTVPSAEGELGHDSTAAAASA